MTEKMTVAGAYAKLNEHEADCSKRYAAITLQLTQLNDLSTAIKSGVKWVLGSLFTIALGLIAWLSVQVYELNREAALPKATQAVATGPMLSDSGASGFVRTVQNQGAGPA